MKRKNILFTIALVAYAMQAWAANPGYTVKVLTFEDDDYCGGGNMMGQCDWSSLIDSPQYGGLLLYGESGAGHMDGTNYWWCDENNTWLYSDLNDAYGAGMPCYWSGGAAVSNYVSTDYTNAGFERQLEAYNPTGGKGGHNGSDNFIVCYGYDDDSPYSMDSRPIFKFAGDTPRIVDHLYMALNCYAINVMINGNSLSEPVVAGDSVLITFEGLDLDGNSLGMVRVSTLDSNYKPILDYVKVDLSELGEIASLRVNMESNIDNGYGLSIPAYCILDDIAVRMPLGEDPKPVISYVTLTTVIDGMATASCSIAKGTTSKIIATAFEEEWTIESVMLNGDEILADEDGNYPTPELRADATAVVSLKFNGEVIVVDDLAGNGLTPEWGDINVTSQDGTILVTGLNEGDIATIYTMSGMKLGQGIAKYDCIAFTVPSGIEYIISITHNGERKGVKIQN